MDAKLLEILQCRVKQKDRNYGRAVKRQREQSEKFTLSPASNWSGKREWKKERKEGMGQKQLFEEIMTEIFSRTDEIYQAKHSQPEHQR